MVQNWFFVEKNHDEKEYTQNLKRILISLRKREKLGYSKFEILTTTRCNANCYYCYERGFEQLTMSKNVAQQVVNFISTSKVNTNPNIRWFGGEPLMNISAINTIADGLKDKNIPFSSAIISNGYLFTDKIIETAKRKWNLDNVRITIDGGEETHNRIKQFRGKDKSPFEVILQNISKLLKSNITVTIRLNIEKHNVDEINKVAEMLYSRFGMVKGLDFMIRTLNNTRALNTIESVGYTRREILNQVMEIKNYLFDNGYNINSRKLSGVTPNNCIADSGRYVLIKPNGNIGFCPENFDEINLGSIFDHNSVRPFQPIGLPEQCLEKKDICGDCPLYVSCYISKLCPVTKKSICDEEQKKMVLNDLELSIKEEYRNYKNK
jgi:sulfatase maturation enzyme AslB (radical SAM superfamily)